MTEADPSVPVADDGEGRDDEQDERLADLERAEGRRAASARLDRRFELVEAVVLSLAAVLAAWAGFQSSKWGSDQADAYDAAAAVRLDSVAAAELADQQRTVDVMLFTQWLDALQVEGAFEALPVEGDTYQPDPTKLSGFYFERFRDEMVPAVHAWLETQPRHDPSSPSTPFVMDEYQLAADDEAIELRHASDALSAEGHAASDRSDQYVFVTILFATVLFFAGISSKLDTARARGFLLGAAIVLLVGGSVVLATFPLSW